MSQVYQVIYLQHNAPERVVGYITGNSPRHALAIARHSPKYGDYDPDRLTVAVAPPKKPGQAPQRRTQMQPEQMLLKLAKELTRGNGKKALESEPREVEHNDKYAPTSPCMYSSDCVIARELLHIALDLQDDEPIIAMGLLDEVKALKLKSRVIEFYKEMRGFQAELADFIGDLKDGVKNPRALSNFPEIADFIGLEKQLRVGPLRHAYETEQMIADKMLQVVKADA